MNHESRSLAGRHVRVEPLSLAHASDLFEAGRDPSLWAFMPRGPLASEDEARAFVASALAELERGDQVPFALVHVESGRAVGSTRFLDLRRAHRGLEIGWTWIAREHQRTAVNTEAKLLLLAEAFEHRACLRVQLKTDARNERSQRAIERLGAVREGVLRRHQICPDGFVRDTVMYSITDAEWPAVKQRLVEKLAR